MPDWLQAAAKIANQYALAAYAIAALVSILGGLNRKRLGGKPILIGLLIGAVVLCAALPLVGKLIEHVSVYRVSVSIFDPEGSRVKSASVSTDVPSLVYRIADTTQVEIGETHVPNTRAVRFIANDDSTGLSAESELRLGYDHNPSLKIVLIPKPSEIRGNIFDQRGNGLEGVRISVVGYDESAISGRGGLFIIQTQIPRGQIVYLLAEKAGFKSLKQQHLAGPSPATLVLESIGRSVDDRRNLAKPR
jgi:hypothetical protein